MIKRPIGRMVIVAALGGVGLSIAFSMLRVERPEPADGAASTPAATFAAPPLMDRETPTQQLEKGDPASRAAEGERVSSSALSAALARIYESLSDHDDEPRPTWDGKPKSMLSSEEREAIQLTPYGLFASRQGPRWNGLASQLKRRGQPELASRAYDMMLRLYRANEPGSTMDRAQLAQEQEALLGEIEAMGVLGEGSAVMIDEMYELNNRAANGDETLLSAKLGVETEDEHRETRTDEADEAD